MQSLLSLLGGGGSGSSVTTADESPAVSTPSQSLTQSDDGLIREAQENGYKLACSLSALSAASHKCLAIDERPILVIRTTRPLRPPPTPTVSADAVPAQVSPSSPVRHVEPSTASLPDGSRVCAIDAICYHMGGPLYASNIIYDIESTAVVCDWHHYRIDYTTGQSLYQALNGKWTSKGVKQRTHSVRIIQENVYVRVLTEESDRSTY